MTTIKVETLPPIIPSQKHVTMTVVVRTDAGAVGAHPQVIEDQGDVSANKAMALRKFKEYLQEALKALGA